MKELITRFWMYIQSSFDTHSKGASARKLTAAAIVVCDIWAHISWIRSSFIKEDFSLLSEILIIDYGFVSALLGMVVYENVQKNKTKNETENESTN